VPLSKISPNRRPSVDAVQISSQLLSASSHIYVCLFPKSAPLGNRKAVSAELQSFLNAVSRHAA